MLDCEKLQNLLYSYQDGKLSRELKLSVRTHLESCIICAQKDHTIKRTEAQLRDLYKDGSVPETLWPRIKASFDQAGTGSSITKNNTPVPYFKLMAASIALLITAILITTRLYPLMDESKQLQAVMVSEFKTFITANRPPDFVSTNPKLLRSWFFNKVKFTPPLPPDAGKNVQLIGARLCNIQDHRAVSYMYKKNDALISLYISASAKNRDNSANSSEHSMRLKVVEVEGYAYVSWLNDGLDYTLVASMPSDDVIDMAKKLNNRASSENKTKVFGI